MLPEIFVQGYAYNDVKFVLPSDIDPKDFKAIHEKPQLMGLRLRDYALKGGKIGLELGDTNRVAKDPGYWYGAVCEVFSLDKQTEDRIGTLTLTQRDKDGAVVNTTELALEDLDTSHLLDRLTSEALNFHANTVGPGPHQQPTPLPRRPRR